MLNHTPAVMKGTAAAPWLVFALGYIYIFTVYDFLNNRPVIPKLTAIFSISIIQKACHSTKPANIADIDRIQLDKIQLYQWITPGFQK